MELLILILCGAHNLPTALVRIQVEEGAYNVARGAYVNVRPGQLTRFGGHLWVEEDDGSASQQARSGPVLFAGEHLSDAWPGYMNGAAQTGRLAAQAIIEEA